MILNMSAAVNPLHTLAGELGRTPMAALEAPGITGAESGLAVFTGEAGVLATKSAAAALASLGGYPKPLRFANTSVSTSGWAMDATYANYPYRKAVDLPGATAAMTPDVVFAPAEAAGGNFAPVAQAYAGGVYLYAKAAPAAAITLPTITLWQEV